MCKLKHEMAYVKNYADFMGAVKLTSNVREHGYLHRVFANVVCIVCIVIRETRQHLTHCVCSVILDLWKNSQKIRQSAFRY